MAFSIETIGRLWAAGRNLGNQAIGIMVGAGLATAAQQQGFVEALDQIWKGAQMIYSGGSSLYAIGIVVLGPPIGWFWSYVAQRSAKTDSQAAAVHAAVAVAERQRATGADLLNAVVLGYDVGIRVIEACGGLFSVKNRFGLNSDFLHALGCSAAYMAGSLRDTVSMYSSAPFSKRGATS